MTTLVLKACDRWSCRVSVCVEMPSTKMRKKSLKVGPHIGAAIDKIKTYGT